MAQRLISYQKALRITVCAMPGGAQFADRLPAPGFAFDLYPMDSGLTEAEVSIYQKAISVFWDAVRAGKIETHGCRCIVGGVEPRSRIEPRDLERANNRVGNSTESLRCFFSSGRTEIYADLGFDEEDVRLVASEAKSPRRAVGAPPKVDWPAIEEAFRDRIEQLGPLDKLNETGWQRQADAERWVIDLVETRERKSITESTARKYISKWTKV